MSIVLSVLATIASSLSVNSLPASVSYEARATSAQTVVENLGKHMGTTITLSPDLSREVVLIKVKDVSGETLLQKLALALQAELKEKDGGWRIETNSALRKAHEESDRQKFTKLLDEWLKNYNAGQDKRLAEPTPSNEPEMEVMPGEEPETPEDIASRKLSMEFYGKSQAITLRLWKAVRDSIQGSTLANLGLEQRVVLSSSPTPRQGAVSPALAAAIKEFNTERAKLGKQIPTGLEDWDQSDFLPLRRLIIIMERVSPSSWSVLAKGFDKDHDVAFSRSLRPTAFQASTFLFDMEQGSKKPPESKFTLAAPKTPIPTPEAFKTLSIFINAVSQGSPPPMVDQKEMLAFFKSPIQNEPLGLTATTAMFAFANDQKANLVGVIPDDAFALESATMMNRSLDLATAVQQLEALPSADMSLEDGWLVVKNGFPSISDRCRLDREALQKVTDLEAADGSISILTKGLFYLTYPEYSQTLWQIYSSLAVPGLSGSMWEGGGESQEAYRFFASLSPADQSALMTGQSIPMARLSPQARFYFEQSAKDITTITGDNPNLLGWFMRWNGSEAEEEQSSPPYSDVTDFPPQAIAESFVMAGVINDFVARPVGNDMSFFMGNMDAETLGMIRQMKDTPEAAEWSAMMPNFDRFRPGNRTRLDLKFVLAQPYGGRAVISGVQMTGDAEGVPYNRLPRQFLDAVRKAEEAYKKMMEEYQEGGQGAAPGMTPVQTP